MKKTNIKFLFTAFLILNVSLFFLPYQQTIFFLATFLNLETQVDKIYLLIPLSKWKEIQFVFLILSLSFFLLFVFFNPFEKLLKWIKDFYLYCTKFKNYVFLYISNLNPTQKFFLSIMLIIIVSLRFYLWITYPIHVDEINSYFAFVNKGFITTISYYPAPNNHILYNLLCNFNDIFFSNPFIIMRLPALFFGFSFMLLFFLGLTRFLPFYPSLILTAVFNIHPEIMYYAVHARGYGLQWFFILISILIFFESEKVNYSENVHFKIRIIVWVCSLYVLPSSIYFVVPDAILLILRVFFKAKGKLLYILKLSIVAFFTVLFLYSPVFLISGYQKLFANNWVKPLNSAYFSSHFFNFFQEISSHIIYFNIKSIHETWLIILIWFVTLIGLILKKKYSFVFAFILLTVLPFVLIFAQKVLPPARTLMYLIPIFFYFGALNISFFQKKHILFIIFPLGFLCSFIYLYSNLNLLKSYKDQYLPIFKDAKLILAQRHNAILCKNDTYFMVIKWEAALKKQGINIDYSEKRKMNEYDYVIEK